VPEQYGDGSHVSKALSKMDISSPVPNKAPGEAQASADRPSRITGFLHH